jgi:NAD-dependent dihydropyrimidine dehydrogenase PreA subunit
MNADDAYAVLTEQLGYGRSERLLSILESLITPDQARMSVALPGTVPEVAEQTGFDEAEIKESLDALFSKGVVFVRGDFITREYYRFARSVGQLHDATLATKQVDIVKDQVFLDQWQDFCLNEWYPDMGASQTSQASPALRIVPVYKAFENTDDVLPCEDFRELMRAQELIAVVPCACRVRTAGVDEPCQHCDEGERWNCLQFGRAADYVIKRGSGKALSIEEALELVDDMEEDALLHIWVNSDRMTGMHFNCNCCRDCCANYVSMDILDEPIGKAWEKSRFEAIIDQDKCDGCQDCVDRCQFDAIDLVKPDKAAKGKASRKSKKMKAIVDPKKCWGCGVCVPGCKEANAIGFKAVRPAEHIPAAVI